MEPGVPISEELRNGECGAEDPLFKVREFKPSEDVFPFLYILNEFWTNVNDEDLWEWVDIETHGVSVRVQKIELQMYQYINAGFKVLVAESSGGVMMGVLVANKVFLDTLAVRAFYLIPEARKMKVGRDLIQSFDNVESIMFQTRRENPPELMFKALKFEPSKVSENDTMITWSVKWENNNVGT
jgi:hypothetical protein